METPLGIFSFSGLEKRSLHLRAIEKGLFVASILRFHKTITFHHVLPLMILVLPHLSSTPRGGLGTFWRRICTAPSAFRPPRLLHGRAASYGSIIVWKFQEAELFGFQGPLALGWFSPLGDAVIKLYIKSILLRSNQLYPFSSNLGTLSTHFCESAITMMP